MTEVLGATLPQSWSVTRIKNVVAYLSRGTAPDYVDEGSVRAISQAANQDGYIDWTRTRFHNCNGDPSKLKGHLKPEDIMVNSTGTGTLGRVGFFEGAPDSFPCMADGHVTIVRTDTDVAHPRFAYYWLHSQPFQDYIYSALIVGATNQIELNRERLSGAPFPLPSLAEQRRIADFLDAETARIDRLMGTRAAQVGLLEEREKIATQEAFGSCKSARRVRLKYLLSCKPRYGVLVPSFTDDGVPFIRVNDLTDLAGRVDAVAKIPYELSNQYRRTITHPKDLLLSVVGTMGRAAIVPPELVGANVARAVASLRPSPGVDPYLLAAWMSTPEFHRQAIDATGSDTAQPTLGMEDLANFSLHWPLDEQELTKLSSKLNEVKQAHTTLRFHLSRQLELLAERRQALITAAVTGQFDVSAASGRGVTE